ncbi:MAG: amidohydrolase family protein [Dongiaceae bacterium]
MLVDAHVHIWSDNAVRYPWRQTLAHVPIPTRAATAEDLLTEMDSARVSHAVLVQPSVYGGDNSYLCDSLNRWSDRFVGICHVPPDTQNARRDLEYWCGERGCQAVRVNIIRQADPSWLLAPEQETFWRTIESSSLSVSMHMELDHAPLLVALAERYPHTTFLVEYLGAQVYRGGNHAPILDRLASLPNILFKLICAAEDSQGPYPFADIIAFYTAVLARFGVRRVVLGSDFPGVRSVCAYADAMGWLQKFPQLSDADRRQVLGGTPARIWRFR